MAEDLVDHRRIFDGGDDLQGAAAVEAMLHGATKISISPRSTRSTQRGEAATKTRNISRKDAKAAKKLKK